MKKCSVQGCDNAYRSRGYCSKHYDKLGRLPNAPRLMAKKGAPGKFIEYACTYESDDCLEWPFGNNKYGVAIDHITKKGRNAHAIVCEKIYGPAPIGKPESAHSCGWGRCVNKRHLRWASYQENNHDKWKHGTSNRGKRHGLSKLTDKEVIQIRSSKGKIRVKDLAKKFMISDAQICGIHAWRDWYWLPQPVSYVAQNKDCSAKVELFFTVSKNENPGLLMQEVKKLAKQQALAMIMEKV